MPDHNEDGKALTKKEKAALQRAAAKEVEATAAAEANRMDPEVSNSSPSGVHFLRLLFIQC